MNEDRVTGRFLEACATGKTVARRVNLRALGVALCQEGLQGVVKLGAVHPAAQMKFLEGWTRVAVWQKERSRLGDDDLWFAALRLLLPPYDGGPVTLFRGQLEADPLGMSWTRSFHIAEKFALYGTASLHQIKSYGRPPKSGATVLVSQMHHEIICAPCLLGHKEGEYIVDPRSVTIERTISCESMVA